MLSVRLFGTPQLEDDDGVLEGRVSQRHPLGLVALLATSAEPILSRDKLLALLWPETGAKRGRARLNTAVHAVRNAAGPEALVSSGDELRLDVDRVQVDVRAFEAALETGSHEEAVALYAGPFMDGFHIDSVPFSQWLDGERDRLRRLYWRALESLAEAATAAGDARRAVDWWRRRAAEEPLSGRVAVRLMEAQVQAGNPEGALQHARIHTQLVEEELDAPPNPEVVRLVDSIRSGTESRGARDGAGTAPPDAAPEPGETEAGPSPVPGPETSRDGSRARRSPRSARRTWIAAALVVAAAAVVTLLLLDGAPDPELVEDRIVILPLENRTGDPSLDPLGRLAADWITQGVSRAGLGRVMPLADLLQTFAPGEALGGISPAEAARITGAGIVVTGGYYRVGEQLQLQARVLDTRTHALIDAVEPVTSDAADPRAGIETLRQRVTGILATVLDPREIFGGGTEITGRPPTLEAYEAFADGLDHFFRLDFAAAAPLFLRAAELDPTFQRATLRALEAYVNLNRWVQADSLLRVLEANRDELSYRDRLLMETFQAHASNRRVAAMDRYGRLARLYPNSYMVYGAAWQGVAYNRPRRAVRFLESMDPSRGPMTRWPAYWRVYGRALHLLREYEAELEVVHRGLREFREPERLVTTLLPPLAALGRMPELRDAVERAEETGLVNRGYLLRAAARELRAHGLGDTADAYLMEALAWYGDHPARERQVLREGIAETLYMAGRYDSAAVLYRQLLEDAPPPDDGPGRERQIELRGRLGTLAARRGDTAGVRAAAEWLTSFDSPYLFGAPDVWRARIAAALGDHDRAVALLSTALEKANYGSWVHTDPDLLLLRGHPGYEALLEPKGDLSFDDAPRPSGPDPPTDSP